MKTFPLLMAATAVLLTGVQAQLMIDFNSTTQDGGPANQEGWQAYDAGHEVAADFIRRDYSVNFPITGPATIGVTPLWPNTDANTVQQSIDRGAANDANWSGGLLNLVTDWIGADTRTANGGNGDFDGTMGTPTFFVLNLSGLPAGEYTWTSLHHDTENMHTPFQVEFSNDGGGSFEEVGNFEMTNSTTGSNPPEPRVWTGTGGVDDPADPFDLPSTVSFPLTASGADDVLVRFTPFSRLEVHEQFVGVNGFVVTQIPEPSTSLLALVGVGLLAFRRRRSAS